MAEQFTISQLAKAVEVPTSTLRYYERAGLLDPENRSYGNYRMYTEKSLHRLRFIRSAQAIGFALDDIKLLLESDEDREICCKDVQKIIQVRLSDVETRLKDLRRVQSVLKSSLKKCQSRPNSKKCVVVESLVARS